MGRTKKGNTRLKTTPRVGSSGLGPKGLTEDESEAKGKLKKEKSNLDTEEISKKEKENN